MPKATAEARQQNAHERALATVASLPVQQEGKQRPNGASGDDDSVPEHSERESGNSNAQIPASLPLVVKPKEETPLPETAEAEVIEVQAKTGPKPVRTRKQAQAQDAEVDTSKKRQPGEDFFDYLQRIDPEEWSNAQTAGLYIYKLSPKGNIRVTDEPLHGPITMQELREQYYPNFGDGTYRLQFQTALKHLTCCGEKITFDANGVSLGGSLTGVLQGGLVGNRDNGIADAIKATSEMLKDGAKAAVEVSKAQQMEHGKPVDVAGIITAVMGAMPKQHEDKTSELLIIMLQNQAKDAERRAEAAEKRAEEQRRIDREDADRRERQTKEDATAARERDNQFFQLMLKQSETKADSLNQMTGLLTSFMKVKETIDDTMGGGPKGPWDLVGQVADGVMQHGPAIVAAMKGASPAQVQQIQQQQNPQPQPQEQNLFYDMVLRLARYFGRDPQLYDGPYICQMLEEEYGPVYSGLINEPKENVLKDIESIDPYGKAILAHPQAGPMMNKIIDAIKFPDTMDDIFGGEPEPDDEKEPIILHGKARKINGREKVERAG